MAWLTSATVGTWLDQRTVAELTYDNDDLPEGQQADHDLVDDHLNGAKARIESAISFGGRYTTPLDDSEVGGYVQQLQAYLAAGTLVGRRLSSHKGVADLVAMAREDIESIRQGASVPGLTSESAANRATKISTHNPSSQTQVDRGLKADTSNYWPARKD